MADVNILLVLSMLSSFEHFKNIASVNSFVPETIQDESSNFVCDESEEEKIPVTKYCDGIPDCQNKFDEQGCENQAILFSYTYSSYIMKSDIDLCPETYHQYDYVYCENYKKNMIKYKLYQTGFDLNSEREFSVLLVSVTNETTASWSDIQIDLNGSEIDIFYTVDNERTRTRVTRSGTRTISDVLVIDNETIQNPVVDWITTNVYYLADYSHIKVCEKNFEVCVPLKSKYIKNPVLLAISPEQRTLFWIERKVLAMENKYQLFRYMLDGSSPSATFLSSVNLMNPKLLTVDLALNRVYWFEENSVIGSCTFDGMDSKKLTLPYHKLVPAASLAVYNDVIYWQDKYKIWSRSSKDNDDPIVFKELSKAPDTSEELIYHHQLIIDHRSVPKEKIENPCSNTMVVCSHLCLTNSKSTIDCYCNGVATPILSNLTNGFCDNTLFATYGNHLYVIGLYRNNQSTPLIRKTTLNISSIAAVIYDSIKGNLIVTEIGMQNIFSWTARTGKIELISSGGPGTINSIEFDDYANNLYWIDPANFAIKVMNLKTRLNITILQGNHMYLPVELTLAPHVGRMFVLFLKNNSSVVLEFLSMDNQPKLRKKLYEDEEARMEDLSLHHVRNKSPPLLCLLDRQRSEIRNFDFRNSEFQDIRNLYAKNKIEGIASIKDSIVWTEANLTIHYGNFTEMVIDRPQEISLGLIKNNGSVLRVTGITKSVSSAKCLENNGGCGGLCLVSGKYKFSCACPDRNEVISGNSCNLPSTEEQPKSKTQSTTSQPSTTTPSSTTTTITERSTLRTTTTISYQRSTPSTKGLTSTTAFLNLKPGISERKAELEQKYYAESPSITSSPLYHPSYREEFTMKQQSQFENHSSHFLYFCFTSTVMTVLGAAVGYLLGKKMKTTNIVSDSRYISKNLELMQIEANSTSALCSKDEIEKL